MKNQRGFTLIELLVVISIIALLSSIILATLTKARDEANAAALESELEQFRSLLTAELIQNGSYNNLTTGGYWASSIAVPAVYVELCDTAYPTSSTDQYVVQANAICKKIAALSPPTTGRPYDLDVTSGTSTFSINSWFYPDDLLYCLGTDGSTFGAAQGVGPPNPPGPDPVVYNNPGCLQNP